MKHSILHYSVGPLLYCPADRPGVPEAAAEEKFGTHYSLAFCLEDTIRDDRVEEAEDTLADSLMRLLRLREQNSFYLPKIFIRVRDARQIGRMMKKLGSAAALVTGFNLSKFSRENADAYLEAVAAENERAGRTVYMMPILESASMIDLRSRYDLLYELKEKLDRQEEQVLNIRVGGNDLCHAFGFRRSSGESIHRIAPVAQILSDIMTVYGRDYVVSGPVWEYYNGPGWDAGLRQELAEDRLCGFVGKTVIHPRQIPLVCNAFRVSKKDLTDARSILGWDASRTSLVSASDGGERMNEYKTHANWALQTCLLAEAYGVLED